MKDLDSKIKAYALKNAIEHNGKANPGAVISALFHEGLDKSKAKEIMIHVNEDLKEINSLSLEEQEVLFKKYEFEISQRKTRKEDELPELKNISKKGIITRFRPSPSGPLHVGHIISNMIASLYVEHYGGKFYVIIDDTDPETTLKTAYENIKKDCDWIFGNVTEYINSSDRMELYYEYIEKLLKKDRAYVCVCKQEEFKSFSEKKKDCPCRSISSKENKERWEKMKKWYEKGEAVLRFKTEKGMKDPNPAMRDFPLARISDKKHPIQGDKYKVWPLMNLVVAVDDLELGMTHVIRGKDHKDNAKRQEMLFKAFGKEKNIPETYFIGRIKFTDLILSKRKLAKAITEGVFENEDDKDLPTISSLRKRNFKPEAFEKLAVQRGLTEVDKVMDSKDFFKLIENFSN